MGQSSRDHRVGSSSGRFDARLWALSALLCAGGQVASRAELSLCSGAGLGRLWALGHAYGSSRRQAALWSGAAAGARLVVQLGIRWALDAEAHFPLRVPGIRATRSDGVEERRPPSTAGLLVSFGPFVQF